jgi:outer membrane protein with beta-barrel domain
MRYFVRSTLPAAAARLLVAAVLQVVLVATLPGIGRAAQLIPSLGFTKSMDSNAGDGKLYGGVALRASLLPFVSAEGGIAYRDESTTNDDLTVRMWPVTASLWLAPVPVLYGGGGIGWYRTTYDYSSALPLKDTTTSKVGAHLGGGLAIPLAPALGLDLNGRYIFMQKDSGVQLPTKFNPDFWSTSAGLAIKF